MTQGGQHSATMRRLVAVAVVAVLAVAAAGCDEGPAAPRPVPPGEPAPAGTARAQLERWVGDDAYPWILGRAASTQDRLVWADRVVRETSAGVGLTIAGSSEARRRAATPRLRMLLEREPTASELTFWAAWLATHPIDQLDAAVAASGEVRSHHPGDGDWLDHISSFALGRRLTSAERNPRLVALARGTSRGSIARDLVQVDESRRWGVAQTYRELGFPPPGGATMDLRAAQLRSAGGNQRVVRAVLAVGRAPARVRLGIVGDSVAWDLWNRGGGSAMGTSIVAPVASAGRIACPVLSTDPQYQAYDQFNPELRLAPRGLPGPGWHVIADGRCPTEVTAMERAMLNAGVEVVLWQIGAWEVLHYRNAQGTVLSPGTDGLRQALVTEILRRIDRYVAGGAQRVLFPEWACVGPRSPARHADPAHRAFIRSVLDQVVAARPGRAAIAPTPPQLCVGGDPGAPGTREGRVARGQQFHWVDGPQGAEWGYANWFAPAVADLPGLR